MAHPIDDNPCRRSGCEFPRGVRPSPGRKSGRQRFCSAACSVWSTRARRAEREGDVPEAMELLRLSGLLDVRITPRDWVPGIFLEDYPRP